MKIWIVLWDTESGDQGVEGYWSEEPTHDFLYKYFKKMQPEEFPKGYDRPLIYWHTVLLEKIDKK